MNLWETGKYSEDEVGKYSNESVGDRKIFGGRGREIFE
jgi:hypothetical protein